MSKEKYCELKGRCQVVSPEITVIRQNGSGFRLFYNVGDMELLHNAYFETTKELMSAIDLIENLEQGLRRNNINFTYIAPQTTGRQ